MQKSDLKIQNKVYKIVSKIPKGKVMTYGQIGKTAGINPRLAGRILHENPDPGNIFCHRVVTEKSKVAENYAFGGGEVQTRKLKREGVEFIGCDVNIKKSLCKRKY
jgi:methylated-DNA-protein-cysteine methyltransferase-like protein